MVTKAARRYARALLDTSIEQGNLEEVLDDIGLIDSTISDSPELRAFLRSPIVRKEVKRSALDEIFKDKVGDLTYNLIGILCDKSREKLLHDITRGFAELYNEHHNIVEIGVRSAFDLDKDQHKDLHEKLESATGKTVRLSVENDVELIGGLTVHISDTVIDGSVKHKLNQLKEKFTAAVE